MSIVCSDCVYIMLIYAVTVTYAPGQPAPFRGFLLQGRQLADDTTPLGTFNIVDDTSQMGSCENQPEVRKQEVW